MKFLFAAFLALTLGPFVLAVPQLKNGLYQFKSEVITSTSSDPVTVQGKAIVFSQYSSTESLPVFSLTLDQVEVSHQAVSPHDFSLPFQFVRLENGLIDHVNIHPEETLEVRNLKKSIAESLQSSLLLEAHETEEAGASGVRKVHYDAAEKRGNALEVRSSYSLKDFTSFAEHSKLEEGHVSLKARKVVSVEDDQLVAGETVVEVVAGKKQEDIKVVARASIRFVSGDVAMIDMIQEADWERESLVHVINPTATQETIKSRLPTISALISQLADGKLSTKAALKVRSQLVQVMNHDDASLMEGLAFLTQQIEEASSLKHLALYSSVVARVNAPQAQELLARKISEETSTERLTALVKSLAALNHPASPSSLITALTKLSAPASLQPLIDLTIAHIAEFLDAEQAKELLIPFLKELEVATTDVAKVQLLHVLGNAGANSLVFDILPYLFDTSLHVRAAALLALRSNLHNPKIQDAVSSFLYLKENTANKGIMSSLLGSMKENMKRNNLNRSKLHATLATLPLRQTMKELKDLLGKMEPLSEDDKVGILGQSATKVWNSTEDPKYELVAPHSQRNQDVSRYPDHNAYLMGAQYGPKLVNMKIATGVFSGAGDEGCLAGDFKIFDKLYTETESFGDVKVLADLQLYVLTYDNNFDSRIYAVINGRVLLDIQISTNCSDEEFIIFDGEISIVSWETEIPFDMGTILIYAEVSASLVFDAGYKICLLTLNPYVELYLTGEITLVADAGADITALGILRAGLEADAFINYRIGPDTQLGTRNSTSGQLTCQACVGVYYGYDTQVAYLGLYLQRREGLGWGEKNPIPLFEWTEPAVPFPTPLVETCTESLMAQEVKKRV